MVIHLNTHNQHATKPSFNKAKNTDNKTQKAKNNTNATTNAEEILKDSPTGMKLLEEAKNNGTKIIFDKGEEGVNGYFDPNNNTIHIHANGSEDQAETLAHELLHATTAENGNSLEEEKEAFKIGESVAAELGIDRIHRGEDFWNKHVDSAYKGDGLKKDNGIEAAMANLGITNKGAMKADVDFTKVSALKNALKENQNAAAINTNNTNIENKENNETPNTQNDPSLMNGMAAIFNFLQLFANINPPQQPNNQTALTPDQVDPQINALMNLFGLQ